MSCTPGKVLVDGVAEIEGDKVFVLKFLQSRDPNWTNRVFFALYDEAASWIDDLKPAFSDQFFFEDQLPADRRWKNFTVYSGAQSRARTYSPNRRSFT